MTEYHSGYYEQTGQSVPSRHKEFDLYPVLLSNWDKAIIKIEEDQDFISYLDEFIEDW